MAAYGGSRPEGRRTGTDTGTGTGTQPSVTHPVDAELTVFT